MLNYILLMINQVSEDIDWINIQVWIYYHEPWKFSIKQKKQSGYMFIHCLYSHETTTQSLVLVHFISICF